MGQRPPELRIEGGGGRAPTSVGQCLLLRSLSNPPGRRCRCWPLPWGQVWPAYLLSWQVRGARDRLAYRMRCTLGHHGQLVHRAIGHARHHRARVIVGAGDTYPRRIAGLGVTGPAALGSGGSRYVGEHCATVPRSADGAAGYGAAGLLGVLSHNAGNLAVSPPRSDGV